MTDVLLIAPFGPTHFKLVSQLREAEYEVSRLDGAASFVRKMRFLLPTVAVVHVELEGVDGIQLIEQACRQGSPTAFVVTTDSPTSKERERAIAAGAADYVSTEHALPVILAELRAAEPSAGAACDRHGCLCFAGLEFDREMRTVAVETLDGTRAFRLPPKEAALLLLLIRQAGNVVDRPELIRTLYGLSSVPGRRRVDQVICMLRARLEPPAVTHRYVHTHAGGYSFRPERVPDPGPR